MSNTWRESLAIARRIVMLKAPYYVPILLSLVPVLAPGLGTIAVTKKLHLLIDEAYVEGLTRQEFAAVIVHEIHHVLQQHLDRIDALPKPINQHVANIAADLTINPELEKQGWTLPKGAILPANFGEKTGLTMEAYYRNFMKGSIASRLNDVCGGYCGSVAGRPVIAEDKFTQDIEGRDKLDIERAVVEVIRIAKGQKAGSLPGLLKELIESSRKGDNKEIQWEHLLRRYIQRFTGRTVFGGSDFSKKKLSKKSFVRGYPLPTLVDNEPEIAVVLDVSGSMHIKRLQEGLTETKNILLKCGVQNVWFLQADATIVVPPKKVQLRDVDRVEIKGRGGTVFNEGLKAVERLKPSVDLCIYITDGEGEATHKPKCEVIWVITSDGSKPEASFGLVVQMKEAA